MWYREKDVKIHFAPISFSKDHVVVVGHTRQSDINIQNLEGNQNRPIMYIDCKSGNFQAIDLTNYRSVNMEDTPKKQETRGRSH